MRHTHTQGEREREREAETQAEGEAGSMQGARRGTRSQDSRIRPWAEGGAKPLSHRGCPRHIFLNLKLDTYFSRAQKPRGIIVYAGAWIPAAESYLDLLVSTVT